jgi:hypothetical protein
MDASASAAPAGGTTVSPGRANRQHERRHPRRRNRRVHAYAARRRLAPHFGADCPGGTEQARQSSHIDRHQVGAVLFVARREFGGNRHERIPCM